MRKLSLTALIMGVLSSASLPTFAMGSTSKQEAQKTSIAYRGVGYGVTKGKRHKSQKNRANRRKARARI